MNLMKVPILNPVANFRPNLEIGYIGMRVFNALLDACGGQLNARCQPILPWLQCKPVTRPNYHYRSNRFSLAKINDENIVSCPVLLATAEFSL